MAYRSFEELEACKESREFRKKQSRAIPIEISPQLPNQPNKLNYFSQLNQRINYSAQSTKSIIPHPSFTIPPLAFNLYPLALIPSTSTPHPP